MITVRKPKETITGISCHRIETESLRYGPSAVLKKGIKQYDESRDATTGRHGNDATKTTDNDSKNNFRSEEAVYKATKSEYRFCPRSDAISVCHPIQHGSQYKSYYLIILLN